MKHFFTLLFLFFWFIAPAQESDSSTVFAYTSGQIGHLKNGKQVLVHHETNAITSSEFDGIEYFNYPFFKIKQNNLFGLIDTSGMVIMPPNYKSIEGFLRDYVYYKTYTYYAVQDTTGKYGVWNHQNQEIIPCAYKKIDTEMTGMQVHFEYLYQKKTDVYSFYEMGNESQELLDSLMAIEKSIPNSLLNLYDNFVASPFFVAHTVDSSFVLNGKNKRILSFELSAINYVNSKILRVNHKQNLELIVFGTNDTLRYTYDTTQLSFESVGEIAYHNNFHISRYFLTVKDGKFGIVDAHTGIIIPPTYDLIENCYAHIDLGSYCGYFASPSWLMKYHAEKTQFYKLRSENGLLRFKLNGKTGLFSTELMQEVFPAEYDTIKFNRSYQNDSICIIGFEDNWALYNIYSDQITATAYDSISSIYLYYPDQNSYYTFKSDDHFGIINQHGNCVEKAKYDSIVINNDQRVCYLYKKGKVKEFDPSAN